MTDRELRGNVQRLYRYKSISSKQFSNAINNLEELREKDLYFYYYNMGKLHSLFGNPDDALLQLEQALALNPGNPTCYYNMYKCYVKIGDFGKAYENLTQFVLYNEKEVDFSFQVYLLETIKSLDEGGVSYLKNDLCVLPGTRCGFNNLSDNPELAKLYNEVIFACNKRNFNNALEKLYRMNLIINDSNYPMEVDTLIALVKTIKEKETNYYLNVLNKEF